MKSSMIPNKQVGFEKIGQQVRYECLGEICRAVIISYSTDSDGSITFTTNRGELKDTEVTEYL